MRRGRRRNDIFDQPWVPIAAVVGILAVIAIAVFFFMGFGGDSGGQPAGPSSSGSGGSGSPVVSGTLDPSAVKELPTAVVPKEGTFVKVSYIGSFAGEYGMPGNLTAVRDSVERVYEIEGATGKVSAVFKKNDASTKPHELAVEIWKDGRVLVFNKTTAPSGEVSVEYTI
jgi:hypothetical protein